MRASWRLTRAFLIEEPMRHPPAGIAKQPSGKSKVRNVAEAPLVRSLSKSRYAKLPLKRDMLNFFAVVPPLLDIHCHERLFANVDHGAYSTRRDRVRSSYRPIEPTHA